ncbi:MAG: hypothetical protein KDH97_03935, partial [Calditrichaeota bacterium]|nr:hypothetical protein [Calditrichota bacterium]
MQPKSTVLPILFVLILHMILLLPALGQQSYTWNVVGGGDWETSGNWFPPGIPAYGDTVFIPADTVQLHIDLSVSVLALSGGAVLRGPGTLTVSDSLFWGYGDMTGSGTTVIAAGAVARVDHGSDNIDLNERVLENYGLLYWLGSGTWKLKNQAQIINHPGAVFDIRRDGVLDYVLDLNGGSFVNHGLLKKTAGSDRLEFDATFTNSPGGTAQSSSGTLRFERGSATPSAGNFIADAGALIQIAERPFQVDGAVFNGAGVVEVVDRANFEVLGSGAAVGDSLTLRMNTDDQGGNGFIQGDGPLTVDGSFEWTRGTVRGSGDLNINGTLQTAAGGTRILEAKTLNNYGNINLNETIRLSGSALLVNQAGGTVAIENGSDIREETPGGQIRNAGTFLRSSAPGISLIQIDFINRGVLEITEGTLAFENALTNSAAGVIQGSDTIKVQGAAFTNSGTVRPGTSPGSLTLIGNFPQDAGSSFDVEIGGNTPGSSYDQLMVSGSAQLDGTLNISLVNGFEPVAGQTFSIMTYGSHSGQFAAVNNAVLNGNSVFAVEYLGSELRLTAGSFDRFTLTALDDGNGSVVIDPPGGEYDAGAVVTLTAQPDIGRYFTHWSGDIDSSVNPLTVTVDSNITVTAHFNELPDFTVTATAGPGGSVMLNPPGGVYDSSTVVTLTAQPAPGYRFSGWSGDLNSFANPDSIYIDGNKTVTASFSPLPVYALNVDTAGNGSVTLDPPGGSYDSSTVVTLTAQPDSGYRFSGWSGDLSGTANPASIVMDSSQQITATFIALPVFALTLDTLGAGGISADPPGGRYDSSATVTLTALPDSGYIFTGWSGDLSGNANPDSIVMNSDKSVSASFLARFALSADTIGTGTVVLSPAGGIYDSAQTVTLVALPASGYYFDGWSGDLSGSANPAYLLMDGDKQLTARFRKLARFSLTVDTLGAGGVSWAPPGSVYDSASVVTLTAAPDSGYYFQGWSGDLSGNDNPLQMLMDANKSVAANFAELPDFTLTLDTIGGGGVALDPPGGIYDSTTVVTLTALPDSGYVFGGWSGDLGGSANPATLLLDADKNVTAIFIAQFQLVIDTVGAGAITATPDTSGRIYDSLTVVTLSAAPAPGYYLSGWSGDLSGRDNPAVIIMNANKTVTGTFQQLPDFNLSTTVNGAGNITLNPPGGVYDSTTVVTLTATADSGYAFTGWSGDLSGLANPDSLLIDGHKSVTANFSPLQVLFTLTVDTSGSGSVQLNPPGGAYDSATVVTLTALPDSGFYFDGWSGDLSGPANPDSLVMDSSKSVTATFRELPDFVLTVTDSGPGTIVLDPPGGIYDSTTTVTVTAVPEYGATFLGWGGDLSGSTNPSTVIMDGNKQISAGFYKAPAYYTWNSGAGDWEDPTKWSPNGIPGPGDTAQVKNVQVTLNSDREVSVLILRAGGALGGGTTLTIRDSLQWTSGDMVDSGRTVIDTACIARISHGDNTIDLNLRTLEN